MSSRLFFTSLLACLFIVAACDFGHPEYRVEKIGSNISVFRLNSEFIFEAKDGVNSNFRVLDFNPNPFGKNNKDEWVVGLGIPMLTTHLIAADGMTPEANTYLKTHYKRDTAAKAYFLNAIGWSEEVVEKLDSLAKKTAPVCARIEGVRLEFSSWLQDGKPREKEKIAKVSSGPGQIDYSKPFLLTAVEEIGCK